MSSKARSSIRSSDKPPVTLKAGDVLFVPAGTAAFGAESRQRHRQRARHLHRREGQAAPHAGEVMAAARRGESDMIEIALAFAAGLLTAAAPCILPLLPVLLGASIGQQDRWRPLFLVTGFIIAFSGFAILFGSFSTVLGIVARHVAQGFRHPARQLWHSAAVAAALRVADGAVERPALFRRRHRPARRIRPCGRPRSWTDARRALDTLRRAGARLHSHPDRNVGKPGARRAAARSPTRSAPAFRSC